MSDSPSKDDIVNPLVRILNGLNALVDAAPVLAQSTEKLRAGLENFIDNIDYDYLDLVDFFNNLDNDSADDNHDQTSVT